jgi:D-alanyl-D-alanine carboxypeptidase (penicillin-binding protein 5/6)
VVTRDGRRIAFASTNPLLGRLPGTIGVKTGYTRAAGPCLIARVRRGPHEVWLVMLDADRRWWFAHGMIERAFAVADHAAP